MFKMSIFAFVLVLVSWSTQANEVSVFTQALTYQSPAQQEGINRKIRQLAPDFKTAEDHWQTRIECTSAQRKSYLECLKEAGAEKAPYRSYLIHAAKRDPKVVAKNAKKYYGVYTNENEIKNLRRRHRKDVAVIAFHGLTSTPYAMAHLSMKIAHDSVLPVYGMTLSGHGSKMAGTHRCKNDPQQCPGSNTSALAHVTYKHWLQDLAFAMDLVINKHGYKKVILMGHSTGAKLIQTAAIHPMTKDYVAGIMLLSPPENSHNALMVSEFLKQIYRRGGGALGLGNTANYLFTLNTMCGLLDDSGVAHRWMNSPENKEFYKDFRFPNGQRRGGTLRYLWISALSKPKLPSKIQYRSPTVGSVCALRDLIEHVGRLARDYGVQDANGPDASNGDQSIKTNVHLQIGLRDNLIEAEHATRVFSDSNGWFGTHRGWVKYARLFSRHRMETAGHSSYLIPYVFKKGKRVADPNVANIGTWHTELTKGFKDYNVQNRTFGETHYGSASISISRRISFWRCQNYRNPRNFVDPSYRPLQVAHGCQVH